MAKDPKHEAAKAITKLGRQAANRRSIGEARDTIREQAKHSARRLAYDLSGNPH